MKQSKNKKSKGKEIMKVVTVSALSLGMFSAAFVGLNRLAFASATNSATPLDVVSAPFTAETITYSPQDEQNTAAIAFAPPNITILQNGLFAQAVPANAIPSEEAALIGAEYLWDVLGVSIDGMYVEMMYTMMPGFTRPFWLGTVYMEKPIHHDFEAFMSFNIEDFNAWIDSIALPSYTFRIDALTGMRVDVSYMHPSHKQSLSRLSNEAQVQYFETTTLVPWFETTAREPLADPTPVQVEAYKQQALELAQRHFNLTTVEDIQFDEIDGNHISFAAIDNTGREAIIRIPREGADWRMIGISTMHNDFIPGFRYDRPGLG